MQGTVTASPLVIDSLACSCAFGGAVVFFGCDISFPLNEKYRKSIGVDWLRRLADAGLFVACDLAAKQKLGWFVVAHAVFLFIGQAKANHWKSLTSPWRGPSLCTENVQVRTIPINRGPQEGRVSYL